MTTFDDNQRLISQWSGTIACRWFLADWDSKFNVQVWNASKKISQGWMCEVLNVIGPINKNGGAQSRG
jgi:hypothetical protein